MLKLSTKLALVAAAAITLGAAGCTSHESDAKLDGFFKPEEDARSRRHFGAMSFSSSLTTSSGLHRPRSLVRS